MTGSNWPVRMFLKRRKLLEQPKEVLKVATKSAGRSICQALEFVKASKGRVRMTLGSQPLSEFWGHERGLPICRYYVEEFLKEFASDINGHCLEFQEDQYTTRFGASAVSKLDILHIDHSNPSATVIADLTKPNDLPNDHFDCIVCTFVLHSIFALDKAISELHRIMKPDGVLLVAVPHISMCDPRYHELWRFTPKALEVLLGRVFGFNNVIVRAYGNSLTAAGQIRGLVLHEFTEAELRIHDPRFAVTVCARAVKKAR
jgi:SAM-dependent methyltransferase